MDPAAFNTLLEKAPLITDGGWGTELQQRGLGSGIAPEAWNRDARDNVRAVAEAYVKAGSQIILSNTFGGSSIKLAGYGLADQARELNRLGAQISKEAAGDKALVFASIGPCGKMVMMGDIDEDEVEASFAEQAEALAEGGADAIVIETMTDLEEASLALKAARRTGLPVVVTLAYDSGPELDRTMMGVSPAQAAERLGGEGAMALGANCGQGVEAFIALVEKLRAASTLPVWAKANAGMPQLVDGKMTYAQPPEAFAAEARKLVEKGASFVGGCCGTNPAFIAALRRELNQS
ncbi:MAG: homocysteine S-methyltransferase family protein [Opitutales bacterium]